MVRRSLGAWLLLAVAFGFGGPVLAFEAGPTAVGRISFVEGRVEIGEAGAEGEYEEVVLNYPVAAGSRIRAAYGARVEVRVGPHVLRLEGPAVLETLELEQEQGSQFWFPEGALNVRLRDLPPDGSFAIATPWANVLMRAAGSYRIDAEPHVGSARIAVRSGEVLVAAEVGELALTGGRTASASASGLMEYEGSVAYGDDALDRWSLSQEAEEPAVVSAGYVPPDVTGYEELERYGTWSADPAYGPVWAPDSDYSWWSPYQYGQWGWVPSWGWTWVDHAPWAFTTFRLGQWVFLGSRWFWAPGHFGHRPILSAFVPFRPGQIIFTTPFLFHGKPAVNFVPLHSKTALGARRLRHGHHGAWSAGGMHTMPQVPAAERQAPGSVTQGSGARALRRMDGLPPSVARESRRGGGFISTPGGVTRLPSARAASDMGGEPRAFAPAGPAPAPAIRAAAVPRPVASVPIAAPGEVSHRGEAAVRHGFRGGRFAMEAGPAAVRAWGGAPAPQRPLGMTPGSGSRGEAGVSHRRGHRDGNAAAHGQGRGSWGAARGAAGGHWRGAGQRR